MVEFDTFYRVLRKYLNPNRRFSLLFSYFSPEIYARSSKYPLPFRNPVRERPNPLESGYPVTGFRYFWSFTGYGCSLLFSRPSSCTSVGAVGEMQYTSFTPSSATNYQSVPSFYSARRPCIRSMKYELRGRIQLIP